MTDKEKEIYLIDGSSYIYRAYHTTGNLTNSNGLPTGAIFGFTNMLLKTLRESDTDRVAVVFDSKGPTFRHEKYDEYKANRPPMPEDLSVQIPKIHEIVEAYGLPSISRPGFEADDIIATLVKEARAKGYKVTIVSGDKDLMQIVGDDVKMWDPQRDKVFDAKAVEKKFGVGPDRLRDLLALMGDTSDNIPGVQGIGPKTAARLLKEYGSLDGIFDNVEGIKQKKLRENLQESRDKAVLSRELVRLDESAPIDVTVDDIKIEEQDTARLREIFKELEFKRLLDTLPPERSLDFSEYATITDLDELRERIEGLKAAGRFAVDLETTSLEPVRADLVGISFCCENGRAAYVPVGHTYGKQPPKEKVLEAFKPLLEDESIEKIGQNIKYDLVVLRKHDVDIRGIACDTMLASYLLDPSRRGHSLDDLSRQFLNHNMIPIKDLIGTGKKQKSFAETDIPTAAEYACEDADVTLRVAEVLCPKVEEEGLGELFRDVELPLVPILAGMELTGVRVDVDYLKQLSREFAKIIERTEKEIFKIAGETFNINSPKQLGHILFDKLGLKPVKKTKTGPSTSLEVLEQLAVHHPLPRLILDYRSVFKLKSTYADALVELVNPETGRIHTSYNQAVTATGRLSSSDPNLQNIPVRTPEGRKIRAAFVPDPGYMFVSADYSQIELRVMAHVSGDERLREAFSSGEDIHAITAASVFGVQPAHVTPEMRQKAKAINFGIMFGMGPYRLAREIGVGMKMARKYLEDYYATYAGVRRFMDELPKEAEERGFVTTMLGRKRYLPELKSNNKTAQQAARRMAINTTVQGSAADLIKLAMIRVSDAMERNRLPGRMILQVHDEIILEVREEAVEDAEALLREEMSNVYPLAVPLVVDTAVGRNWEEAH